MDPTTVRKDGDEVVVELDWRRLSRVERSVGPAGERAVVRVECAVTPCVACVEESLGLAASRTGSIARGGLSVARVREAVKEAARACTLGRHAKLA